MKTNLFTFFLLVFGIFFVACEPDTVNTEETKNYWQQNSLVRLQLKGKVKTLTSSGYSSQITQFDENGFIKSISSTGTGWTSMQTFTYSSSGHLIKSITVNTNQSSETTTSTVNYEYDTHGKLIVNTTIHLYESGLTPNLKAIITDYGRTDYVFNGNNLQIISSFKDITIKKDTAIVKYNGNYPSSISTAWSFCKDISFADNGMFKTYTEGFQGPNYISSRIYTFKTDNEYMLKESVRFVDIVGSQTTTETISYIYNDKKDLIKETRGANTSEYVYVYDSQNNWISRTCTSINEGSSTPVVSTETRTIAYY